MPRYRKTIVKPFGLLAPLVTAFRAETGNTGENGFGNRIGGWQPLPRRAVNPKRCSQRKPRWSLIF